MHKIDIIVPSYGRPDILQRCLRALLQQSFSDFRVLCVCRRTDKETLDLVARLQEVDLRVCEVVVDEPGLVVALNAGLRKALSPFVGFTDDDAEAPTHWLQTIIEHFAKHSHCGAVGGPDRLQFEDERMRNPKPVKRVGTYSWTGKWYATHHCPILEPFVKCAILKGVNMTYRLDLIRDVNIGEGLRGRTCTEQSLAARVTARGYEHHFVRDAWVLHHAVPRLENDDRLELASKYALDTTYNRAYTLCRYAQLRVSTVVLARGILVGSRYAPGMLFMITQPQNILAISRRLIHTLKGACNGFGVRFGLHDN